MFDNIQEIKHYVNVSAQLDIKLLTPYLEEALRVRVYPYIPKSVCEQIVSEPYYELLKKAVANYAVAYSIPFLKVHLSNTGGNNFVDSKMQKSAWWDLRDFGLSAVGVAERAMQSVMYELYQSPYKSSLSVFGNKIFVGLWEFSNYFLLDSWEVFLKLQPVINRVWQLIVSPRLGVCTIDDLCFHSEVWTNIQAAIAYFSVSEMIEAGGVSFTNNTMLIQWEELPWQQSKLLNKNELNTLYESMINKANIYLNNAISIIRKAKEKDPSVFMCFIEKQHHREVIVKKSGLYL